MNGKQLKNSILQWAIQGKLVPQDPNDEPASVLLDKIRQEKERLIKEKKIKRDKNASIIYRGEDNSYYEKFIATGEVKCIDEEIPFEIPATWEWARINTIGISQLGKTLDRGKNIGQEYPYLCSINVYWDGIDLSKIKTFKLRDDELPKYRLHKGDLLICEGGDYGRCCVWDRDEEMYYQNALHRIRFYCGLFPIFYKFVFELYRNIGYIVGQGQTIKHFTYESMKSIVFPVPSISEQKRIVELLKEVLYLVKRYDKRQDALNYLNERINVKLQKSILQEAIQGKLVPQIAEEGTAEKLLAEIRKEKERLVKEGKLKKSVLSDSVIYKGDDNKYWEKKGTTCECIDEDIPFDIPKSWAWARLETILNTGSARRVHAKDWRQAGIPFYRAREIGKLADEGFVDNELYIDLSLYEDFSSSGVPLPNDLMITAVGTLGKVYIVKESDKFYYKDGSVLCLANKYGLCAEYLKMVIESPFFKGQYSQESQGTTVATLTMVRLQKYFIPIPPLQEQYRIVETYRNIASIMS